VVESTHIAIGIYPRDAWVYEDGAIATLEARIRSPKLGAMGSNISLTVGKMSIGNIYH
jgi:hypothetical protein